MWTGEKNVLHHHQLYPSLIEGVDSHSSQCCIFIYVGFQPRTLVKTQDAVDFPEFEPKTDILFEIPR